MLKTAKKYHQRIINSNHEECKKVELLSDLLETLFKYMEEREEIHINYNKTRKKILNNNKNEIDTWVQKQQ